LAAKVTFDGPNKLVIINSSITEIDVRDDLYSDWKEEVISGVGDDLSKFEPVFVESIGTNDFGGGKFLGAFFIFNNAAGWRIRAAEENSEVDIVGNLFPVDPNTPMFTTTVGSFNTQIILTRSIDALVVSTTPVDIADAVWETGVVTHTTAGTMGLQVGGLDYGGKLWVDTTGGGAAGSVVNVNGTRTNPVDNFSDLTSLIASTGYNDINLKGVITFTGPCPNTNWENTGTTATVIVNGQDITSSSFIMCDISGDCASSVGVLFNGCTLINTTNWQGDANLCPLIGTISLVAGGTDITTFSECVAGSGTPVIDTQGAALTVLSMPKYVGQLDIRGLAGSITAIVVLDAGSVSYGATNIGGTLVLSGQGSGVDTGNGGTTVLDSSLLNPSTIAEGVHVKNRYSKRDLMVYDVNGFLTSARERWFPTKLDATNGTNATDTFTISATPDGTEVRQPATFDKIRDV
jgi:hypothetical protein